MKIPRFPVLLAAWIMLFAPFLGGAREKPLWVAHRGANQEADENTIKAYKIAAGYGVDFIECDPRLTRDGIFISMHDPSVERTTDGKGYVSEMTLSEIKSLKTKNGEPVPTLEEIFNFAKSAGVGVYLDTKGKDLVYLKQLTDFVEKSGMEKRVIAGVWSTRQLKWLNENQPEMKTCISWPWPSNSLGKLKKLGADWVGTAVSLADKEMINSAHKHGLKVITLQINDPKTISEKISLGIDAVQTDDPRLIKEK